jgi:hypothetical protein
MHAGVGWRLGDDVGEVEVDPMNGRVPGGDGVDGGAKAAADIDEGADAVEARVELEERCFMASLKTLLKRASVPA